ncbi:hypothetical protein PENTCL1PPCAC_23587 [Pristionchus entomophagus]|uniref:Uncharacterized protein n=1 Tax=Pristionchus entomophagus TaxID=358040 RepID=A0AAV5U463_9BILA|nr:hypothetical protein PENTCL1PPCAC_23587 [Pristionchus entomophagus]
MKRLLTRGSSSSISVKFHEASVTWTVFPNACRRVTTAAVRSSEFHDFDRLFSALIRIVRREMTFNEASASHHISLNLIKAAYKKIVTTMRALTKNLRDDKKEDIELKGDEMDENGFHFDEVSEDNLIITTNEKGEEYAIVDPSIVRLKKNRFEPVLNSNETGYGGPEAPIKIKEEKELKREIKDEPIDDFLTTNANYQMSSNTNEFGNYKKDAKRVKMEVEESHSFESPEEEEGTSPSSLLSSSLTNGLDPRISLDQLDTNRLQIIQECISAVTLRSQLERQRKGALNTAIFNICMGELTLNEASKKFDLNDETVRKNVQKVRLRLGSILPPEKVTMASHGIPKIIPTREDSVTIDGVTVPKSIQRLKQMLTIGKLDQSNAQPFFGTKEELREKLVTILQEFNSKADIQSIADGMMLVSVDGRSNVEAYERYNLTKSILSDYFRAIKIFIDFAKSPCTHQYQFNKFVSKHSDVLTDRKITLARGKPEQVLDDESLVTIRDDEAVTIDGIRVPKAISVLLWWLSIGRLDYSKALPFLGTKDELRERLITTILTFKFKGNLANLVDGILQVCMYQATHSEVHRVYKISKGNLSNYIKCVKVFIDFATSPCIRESLNRNAISTIPGVLMDCGGTESPQAIRNE